MQKHITLLTEPGYMHIFHFLVSLQNFTINVDMIYNLMLILIGIQCISTINDLIVRPKFKILIYIKK